MHSLELRHPDWWLMYFPECDGVLAEKLPFECMGHRIQRHYPGQGSIAMLMVIRSSRRFLLSGVQSEGRCMAATFHSSRDNFTQHILAMHGGHGENLAPSFASASILCKSFKRSDSVICLGDINVDLLPTLSSDPFGDRDNRSLRHLEERIVYQEFLDANYLECQVPGMEGTPGGAFYQTDWIEAACSRMPLGDSVDTTVPSLLDHASYRNCIDVHSQVSWDLDWGDHAYLKVSCALLFRTRKARPRTTWCCDDKPSAEQWIIRNSPTEFNDWQECCSRQHDSPVLRKRWHCWRARPG